MRAHAQQRASGQVMAQRTSGCGMQLLLLLSARCLRLLLGVRIRGLGREGAVGAEAKGLVRASVGSTTSARQ